MCGVLALATITGRPVAISDEQIATARDRMTHRGPDDAGLWRDGPVVLAHRRLSVIDPTPAGHQPMVAATAEGPAIAIAYNGELYNDAELRSDLAPRLRERGMSFQTSCDTETVLRAFEVWGAGALERFRGMYALAVYDARDQTLVLARDPLGIKPLFVWRGVLGGSPHVAAASEPGALLACPGIDARPDPVGVRSYLTTIRTVNGPRTMFEGVESLEPGECVTIDLGTPSLSSRRSALGLPSVEADGSEAASVMAASVGAHLRSDVPMCSLLSGGLDSSVIAALAMAGGVPELHTYCSGAIGAEPIEGVPQSEDFEFARLAAEHLGTRHHEVPVTQASFAERWSWLIEESGVPLSTPNEVAIYEVARSLRADGRVVALSGEGADELFAGYEGPLRSIIEHTVPDVLDKDLDTGPDGGAYAQGDARFQIEANAWVPPSHAAAVVGPVLAGDDDWLERYYTEMFKADARDRPSAHPDDSDLEFRVQTHLRAQRRVNLTGLLHRLDSSTMRASVEGRTPFADRAVASFAESLALSAKFGVAPDGRVLTKRAVRDGFRDALPASIIERPKASFPLPFQRWMVDQASWFRASPGARELFTDAAVEHAAADPSGLWRFAWPMMNAARWFDRWWG